MNWEIKRLFVRSYKNSKRFWKDFSYDVKSAFKEIFWYFPRNVVRWVVKVVQYAPVLWGDVDYDYSSLLKLMKYKISRIRNHMEEHDALKNSKKYCAQMKEVEELIENELKDEWAEKEREEHDQKWGKSKITTIKVPGKPYAECRFLRLEVRDDKTKKQEHNDYVKIMNLEEQRKKGNWNRLFKILKNNMRNFWD